MSATIRGHRPPPDRRRHRQAVRRRHADRDADRLRLPDRPDPRRGRHPDAARRRFARPGRARLRDHRPGDDGRDGPPHEGRRPRHVARPDRRPTCRSCPTATPDEAVENAGIFLREAGAQAVKVEGGVRTARVIETLVRAGIPVMGHIGLTPQSINAAGKIRVQGKTRDQARALIADALAVQEAGAFSMVLELVPEQLAAAITERLRVPTIGIGAGAGCSGQVQIITDLIGLGDFIPRHARPYVRIREHDPRGRAGATPPTSPRARSRDPSRPSGWTTRSSTRCSVAARPTGRPARSRRAASRSIATSKPPAALDRGRPHPRRAARRPGRRRPPGRPRPDDGLAARRPPRADAPGPRRRRDDGRDDLRQPAPVQRRRRLHEVPAQRGA